MKLKPRKLAFHYNNAWPHTVRKTLKEIDILIGNFLNIHCGQIITCFVRKNMRLEDRCFSTDEDAEREVHRWMMQHFNEFYTSGIRKLIKMCDKYINVNGGYVET